MWILRALSPRPPWGASRTPPSKHARWRCEGQRQHETLPTEARWGIAREPFGCRALGNDSTRSWRLQHFRRMLGTRPTSGPSESRPETRGGVTQQTGRIQPHRGWSWTNIGAAGADHRDGGRTSRSRTDAVDPLGTATSNFHRTHQRRRHRRSSYCHLCGAEPAQVSCPPPHTFGLRAHLPRPRVPSDGAMHVPNMWLLLPADPPKSSAPRPPPPPVCPAIFRKTWGSMLQGTWIRPIGVRTEAARSPCQGRSEFVHERGAWGSDLEKLPLKKAPKRFGRPAPDAQHWLSGARSASGTNFRPYLCRSAHVQFRPEARRAGAHHCKRRYVTRSRPLPRRQRLAPQALGIGGHGVAR